MQDAEEEQSQTQEENAEKEEHQKQSLRYPIDNLQKVIFKL